jgi:hypothetical protein
MGLIASACCVAIPSGCLDTEKTVLITYDAGTDTFTYLVVYQQIRGVPDGLAPPFSSTTLPSTVPSDAPTTWPATQPTEDGLNDIHAIVKWRRDLIVSPLPKWLLCDFGLLKQPNGKANGCDVTNLSTPTNNADDKSNLIDVRAVRIIPGTFFRRSKGNLCYYQAVVLPGSVVDQVIDLLNKSDEQSTNWQQEIDARKSAKVPPIGWPEYGKHAADFLGHLNGSESDANFPTNTQALPFSLQSLQMLRDQEQHHQFRLRRSGPVVWMDVKLGADDVDGAMRIIDMVRKSDEVRLKELADPAVQQQIKDGADGIDALRAELAIVDAIMLDKVDPHTLRIKFDLIRFCTDGTLRPTDPLPPVENGAIAGTNFSDKDVPIDRPVTVEKLRADFLAGKLAVAH